MLPSNYNPSDFYINTLAVTPAEKEECLERVNVIFKRFLNFIIFSFLKRNFCQKICDNFEKSQFNTELNEQLTEIKQTTDTKKSSKSTIFKPAKYKLIAYF